MVQSFRRHRIVLGVVLCAIGLRAVWAQEGHPLTGTWSGDWGLTAEDRNYVTLVMNFDGERVTGIVNPGPDSRAILVRFDPATWGVGFDVDLADRSGNAVAYRFQGTLENYGSLYHQQVVGRWTSPSAQGDFQVTRQ